MASATEPKRPAPQAATPAEEQLVNAQIERTRRALKWVDLASGLITLVIGVLAFVLVVAILEHWVIPGGWSGGARVVLFASLLLSILWYSWRTFWPLVRKPINPAFAAQTIEQSSPSLKNSLLNLLLLRNRKRQLSRQVYQAIEQQAAQRLSEIPLDTTVDRTAVLRLGYILVAIVALCALYRIFSPKDFMASATRVLMPWADVTVPSRVQILDLTPGNTSAARGDQVVVSAEVMGLDEDEQVRVLYSTEDKQIVGQEIFMSPLEGGLRFECRLPSGIAQRGSGLQQNLTYWVEAGDARSPRYKVTVFSRPTLVVQRIQYDYPNYTGYPDREEAHTGDLHAIEGTVVTLTAIANQPISSAHVDFEADGRLDNLMKAEGQQASISFPLELRDDRRTPRHQSYVLRYTTEKGRKNELPPKYEIEVTPDYSPEVQVLLPEEESVDVALDSQVTIEIFARDPDFEVRDVALLGEVDGQQVLKQVLLKKNHTGRFVKQYQLAPSELGLKVGDVIEYWAIAADNRRPTANQASTKRRKIRIVGPGESGDNEGEKQPGEAGADQQSEEDSQQGEDGKEGTEEGAESADSGDQQDEQGQEGEGEGGVGQDAEGMQGEDAEQQQGQGGGQNQSSEGQDNSEQNSEDAAGGESSGDQNNENPSQDNASDQPGDSQSSEGGGNQEKVSPDGDDDGEAFDRMAEHFEEQQDESGQEGEAAEQQQGQGESADDNQQSQKGNNGAEGKPDADQSGDADGDDAEQGDTKGAEGQQQDENSEGEGAEGDPAPGQEGAGEEQGEQSQGQEDESAGGEMSPEQGEAGAGENPGENEGSPDVQGDKKPHDREGDEAAGEKMNDQEAPAPAEGQTESDSEGGQGGDRSGGGQEGGGQQADAKGTGGAGENQAADEGGGQSEQPGEGDTSNKPGGDQEAEGETGESSGNQPGKGSEQGEGGAEGEQQGDQSADQTGNSEGMDPSTEQQPDQQNANNPDSSNPQGGQPSGGGTGSDSMPPPAGETQPGDEANLDYAQKQTDLILDKLDDQMKKKQVDEGLLEKLGWSQDELRRFVDRWKNLKSEADGKGADAEEAQQELSDTLRSLGLGRKRRTGFQAKTAKDLFRDLQDAPRVRTPLEYQDRLRGYIKGTATAEEEK
ncbi:MAG: hypothetical protein GXP26_14805 [Planctomycetes bacterium]|nr:hypothetical protein [Planctomycetota bacterium]